jgi:hypothetical protein
VNLFYAMGGGWGHLTRVNTFIHQFGISDYSILTNNPLAGKIFSSNQIVSVFGHDQTEITQTVLQNLQALQFEKLFVDAFPVGLFGELNIVSRHKIVYLARRLRWHEYSKLLNQPTLHFEQTFCFEELEENHQNFIEQCSQSITPITLRYEQSDPSKIPAAKIPANKPIWLVVHAFNREELEALLNYAKEMAKIERQNPTFVVLSDQVIQDPDVHGYDFYPAHHWFPLADRIFAGGGFNTLHQAAAFRDKLKLIPFPRKYDDQAWRIAWFTNQGLPIEKHVRALKP